MLAKNFAFTPKMPQFCISAIQWCNRNKPCNQQQLMY